MKPKNIAEAISTTSYNQHNLYKFICISSVSAQKSFALMIIHIVQFTYVIQQKWFPVDILHLIAKTKKMGSEEDKDNRSSEGKFEVKYSVGWLCW